MTTQSSILAWEIPWTEELGRLQSMGMQSDTTGQQSVHAHARTHTHTHGLNTALVSYVQHSDSVGFFADYTPL